MDTLFFDDVSKRFQTDTKRDDKISKWMLSSFTISFNPLQILHRGDKNFKTEILPSFRRWSIRRDSFVDRLSYKEWKLERRGASIR